MMPPDPDRQKKEAIAHAQRGFWIAAAWRALARRRTAGTSACPRSCSPSAAGWTARAPVAATPRPRPATRPAAPLVAISPPRPTQRLFGPQETARNGQSCALTPAWPSSALPAVPIDSRSTSSSDRHATTMSRDAHQASSSESGSSIDAASWIRPVPSYVRGKNARHMRGNSSPNGRAMTDLKNTFPPHHVEQPAFRRHRHRAASFASPASPCRGGHRNSFLRHSTRPEVRYW
jgi:hypothetical protein